ncbi:MAG: DUF3786 domain-containing protein, partial [Thermodesulfobacteriota bacterium]|nr:DUF3786 domain-containing protein [Thermodesulfobacteriota bacterium]
FKDDESIYIENKKDIKTSFRAQILILHYLNNSDGEPHAGEWITYRQLKTGPFYYPAFKKRSIEILEKSFNNSPDKLKSSALTYDAERAEFGDMGFVFQVLPRVPVALAFWKGDREFAPEINLLFDSSITHYLPLEDITVVCQELALKLVQKE